MCAKNVCVFCIQGKVRKVHGIFSWISMLFQAFLVWNSALSKKSRNPGKLRIIPGFPSFFTHRGKPGKSGAFLPDFPGSSRLLGVT